MMFDPFERRSGGRTGLGLGLSISKRESGERREAGRAQQAGEGMRFHNRSAHDRV
jgi:signal transduction histidine kinase